MEVEIVIKKELQETKLVIYCNELTKEVQQLVDRLGAMQCKTVAGIQDENIFLLNPEDIDCFYSENQKVYAKVGKKAFWVKKKLYELEEMLTGTSFVRVSNSCIVNMDQVDRLDISYAGTIELILKTGEREFVSRRYMSKIKKYLGI
ncbi:LytTR family DNA-binding domain-containing protein [Ectobacillus polymachus]|uniref:LytTR family DNA-binding domain-containing protein n=1 Tax=Ectobacillus polymachus TaxID=1508806 RepID=UPI003A879D29